MMSSRYSTPGSALALLTAVALVLGGCGADRTLTLAEADRRTVDLVRDVVTVLAGGSTTIENRGGDPGVCESDTREDTGQRQVNRTATVLDLALQDVQRTGDDVRRRLEQQGFRLTDSGGNGDETSSASYYNDADGFRVLVRFRSGVASVTAASPCVWPNGTPP